jgi:hypothetical protein
VLTVKNDQIRPIVTRRPIVTGTGIVASNVIPPMVYFSSR